MWRKWQSDCIFKDLDTCTGINRSMHTLTFCSLSQCPGQAFSWPFPSCLPFLYLTFPPHCLYLGRVELINITKNYMVGLIVSFARELIESKLCGLRFLISHLGSRCPMQWSECRVPQHPSPWHLGRRIQSGPGQSIMWLLEVACCTADQQNTITASRIHISEGPRNTASSFEAFVTTAMENACLGLGDRKLLLLFSC